MRCTENRVIVTDKLQDRFQFRNDPPVFYDLHAPARVLLHLLQMVLCRLGRKPDDLCAHAECHVNGLRIYSADRPVQRDPTEHREVVRLSMYDLVVAVTEICPVHRRSLMSLDHDGPRTHTDRSFHQFEIIIGTKAQIRICMNMHVNNTLHKIHFHQLLFPSDHFCCCFLTGFILY